MFLGASLALLQENLQVSGSILGPTGRLWLTDSCGCLNWEKHPDPCVFSLKGRFTRIKAPQDQSLHEVESCEVLTLIIWGLCKAPGVVPPGSGVSAPSRG